eukprot:1865993-Rhodomonas_salina.2
MRVPSASSNPFSRFPAYLRPSPSRPTLITQPTYIISQPTYTARSNASTSSARFPMRLREFYSALYRLGSRGLDCTETAVSCMVCGSGLGTERGMGVGQESEKDRGRAARINIACLRGT